MMWRRSFIRRTGILVAATATLLCTVPATRAADAHPPLGVAEAATATWTGGSPPAVRAAASTGARTSTDGYRWINYYRSLGGLGPVTRDVTMQSEEAIHVRYLADHALACETNVHDELTGAADGCPANPYATEAGRLAATNSDITRVNAAVSDRVAVRNWFVSGFHALTLLEPRLRTTGYAAYYTPAPAGEGALPYRFTAGVDVYRGRSGSYAGQTLAFPATGAVSPLLSYRVGTESPEPFRDSLPGSGCHAWGTLSTVSAPIVVQWAVGAPAPAGTGTLTDLTTGRALPTCVLTADSYLAGSPARTFLLGTNRVTQAALYYTDAPFQAGHEYRLSAGGVQLTSFTAAVNGS